MLYPKAVNLSQGKMQCQSYADFPTSLWLDELKGSYDGDIETKALLTKLERQANVPKGYTLLNGLILKTGRILIVAHSHFKEIFALCP